TMTDESENAARSGCLQLGPRSSACRFPRRFRAVRKAIPPSCREESAQAGAETETRFPRFWRSRLKSRFALLPGRLFVGQSTTSHTGKHNIEAFRVGHFPLAIPAEVEAESLLIGVPLQVERLDRNVGSAQRPLEQAPVVLKAVGVDPAIHISLQVVDHLMHESAIRESGVGNVLIGVDVRSVRDVLKHRRLQAIALGILENRGPNLASLAVKYSLHANLVGVMPALALRGEVVRHLRLDAAR